MDAVFAPKDTVLSKSRTAPRVALPSLGMGCCGASLVAPGAHSLGSCSCRCSATEPVWFGVVSYHGDLFWDCIRGLKSRAVNMEGKETSCGMQCLLSWFFPCSAKENFGKN